jgi:hypothetical protein
VAVEIATAEWLTYGEAVLEEIESLITSTAQGVKAFLDSTGDISTGAQEGNPCTVSEGSTGMVLFCPEVDEEEVAEVEWIGVTG